MQKTALTLLLFKLGVMSLTGCSSPSIRSESKELTHSLVTQENQLKEKQLGVTRKNSVTMQKNTEASAEYHFSLAQAYVAEGNLDRAIEEYKLTLMFDPNSALVYARLAIEYIKKGMLSAAMETCKEALQRDPHFIDARLILAGLYSTSRETQAALSEYDTVLKFNPKHEEAAIYKAQVLMETNHSEEATRFLQQFIKKANPESALAYYYLGRAEQNQEHFTEAITAYRTALELRPNFNQAAFAMAYLYEERQMNAQAQAVYRDLYESTQDLAAANRLATIYLKEEKYKEAMPYLEAIQAADPEDMNVRVKLGLIYMEVKQYDKAIGVFTSILDKNPEADRVHYYLGSLYEEVKKFDFAIVELKKIKPGSKLYIDASLHVAYLLKQSERMNEAKAYIREAISKSPETPNFYILQASLEEETKNLVEAGVILESAVKRFPEDEKIRYYLGSVYDRSGEVDKGLEQMEAILKLNPENVDALNYIGYTWTQKGIRLNDAEKVLRKALDLKPDNGYIQDSWGWYLFVRGKVEEAVVALEKAIRLKPNEPTILEHLGDAYLKSSLREKALTQYQNAAKFAEDEDTKKKLEMKAQNLQRVLVQKEKSDPSSKDSMPPPSTPTGSPTESPTDRTPAAPHSK